MLSGGSVQILPKNASETINAPIMASAPGVGLTLLPTGTGVLTINGPASYTGPTNVSSGTLLFNGPDSTSSISVGNGNKTVGAGRSAQHNGNRFGRVHYPEHQRQHHRRLRRLRQHDRRRAGFRGGRVTFTSPTSASMRRAPRRRSWSPAATAWRSPRRIPFP